MFDGILQPTHLLIILVIVLIIFGPGKLPNLGKALGQSIKEFRDSTTNGGSTNGPVAPGQAVLQPPATQQAEVRSEILPSTEKPAPAETNAR